MIFISDFKFNFLTSKHSDLTFFDKNFLIIVNVLGTTLQNKIFSIVECLKCGLNFTNPRPPITEIDKYYSSDYSFFKDDNIFKSIYRKIFIWISEKDFLCYILRPGASQPEPYQHHLKALDQEDP